MAPGFFVEPILEIFRGGSAVAIPFLVCNSDAARFEGIVRVCREEEDEGVGFGCSLCGWGFGVWMGMLRAADSAGASRLCEKRQVIRSQFWTSGHLVFLNNPRFENIATTDN